MPLDNKCIPCQKGKPCTNKEEDVLYNIISQFQDTEINVLKDDKLAAPLEMLKELGKEDDKLSTSSSLIQDEMHIISSQKGPYTMPEVNRLLRERQKVEAIPAITQDLNK